MNPIHPAHLIRRVAVIMAGLTVSLLAISTGAPAAFAYILPPHPAGGTAGLPSAQTIVTGGMPGWQITLIAAGAALLTAAVAVLVERALAARRRAATSAA